MSGKVIISSIFLVFVGIITHGATSIEDSRNAPALTENGSKDGITFYAGFEGTPDASVATGDRHGDLKGKTVQYRDGIRGKALLAGDGEPFVEYEASGNMTTPEGSIEMWVKPLNWDLPCWGFHIFFRAESASVGEIMQLYKYGAFDGDFVFFASDGKSNNACSVAPGKRYQAKPWRHFVAAWNRENLKFYVDGVRAKETPLKSPVPANMVKFFLGDDPWADAAKGAEQPEWAATATGRNAQTLIDEVYIYNRALTDKEAEWAYLNKDKRKAGEDIPFSVVPAISKIVLEPNIEMKRIEVKTSLDSRVSSDKLTCELSMLGPEGVNAKEIIVVSGDKEISSALNCERFPRGDFNIKAILKDETGKVVGEKTEKLYSPGPPVWLGNKIGISNVPPKPYTPIQLENKGFSCWNRKVEFDQCGFLKSVVSGEQQLLAEPMELFAAINKKKVTWGSKGFRKLSSDANRIVWESEAVSELGELSVLITAEYDGMIRYDMTLNPEPNAVADELELRIPLRKEAATLCNVPGGWQQGVFVNAMENDEFQKKKSIESDVFSWKPCVWVGNDDLGLTGVVESDEAWDKIDRKDAFRLDRKVDSIDMVWSFSKSEWKLPSPWKLTIGLQPTPVKESPRTLRKWRYGKDTSIVPGANFHIYWTQPGLNPYFGYPETCNFTEYELRIKTYRSKGIGLVPYSLLTQFATLAPEYKFYFDKYRSPESKEGAPGDVAVFGKDSTHVVVTPVPEYIDFIVWKNYEYVKSLGLLGLYHDLSVYYPSSLELANCGYLRDGKRRPTHPVFATRAMYQRIYTMLKELEASTGDEKIMINHCGPDSILGAYCDFSLFGEGNKEDYRRDLNTTQMRVYSARALGYRCQWLPQPAATGVASQAQKDQPTASSRYLIGMLLLHDMNLSAVYINVKEAQEYFKAIDAVGGLVDAEFLPYWNNRKTVGWKDDVKLLCSAYVKSKPGDGALLCVVNPTTDRQSGTLQMDFAALNAGKEPKIKDLLSGKQITVNGDSIAVEADAYGYCLFQVK